MQETSDPSLELQPRTRTSAASVEGASTASPSTGATASSSSASVQRHFIFEYKCKSLGEGEEWKGSVKGFAITKGMPWREVQRRLEEVSEMQEFSQQVGSSILPSLRPNATSSAEKQNRDAGYRGTRGDTHYSAARATRGDPHQAARATRGDPHQAARATRGDTHRAARATREDTHHAARATHGDTRHAARATHYAAYRATREVSTYAARGTHGDQTFHRQTRHASREDNVQKYLDRHIDDIFKDSDETESFSQEYLDRHINDETSPKGDVSQEYLDSHVNDFFSDEDDDVDDEVVDGEAVSAQTLAGSEVIPGVQQTQGSNFDEDSLSLRPYLVRDANEEVRVMKTRRTGARQNDRELFESFPLLDFAPQAQGMRSKKRNNDLALRPLGSWSLSLQGPKFQALKYDPENLHSLLSLQSVRDIQENQPNQEIEPELHAVAQDLLKNEDTIMPRSSSPRDQELPPEMNDSEGLPLQSMIHELQSELNDPNDLSICRYPKLMELLQCPLFDTNDVPLQTRISHELQLVKNDLQLYPKLGEDSHPPAQNDPKCVASRASPNSDLHEIERESSPLGKDLERLLSRLSTLSKSQVEGEEDHPKNDPNYLPPCPNPVHKDCRLDHHCFTCDDPICGTDITPHELKFALDHESHQIQYAAEIAGVRLLNHLLKISSAAEKVRARIQELEEAKKDLATRKEFVKNDVYTRGNRLDLAVQKYRKKANKSLGEGLQWVQILQKENVFSAKTRYEKANRALKQLNGALARNKPKDLVAVSQMLKNGNLRLEVVENLLAERNAEPLRTPTLQYTNVLDTVTTHIRGFMGIVMQAESESDVTDDVRTRVFRSGIGEEAGVEVYSMSVSPNGHMISLSYAWRMETTRCPPQTFGYNGNLVQTHNERFLAATGKRSLLAVPGTRHLPLIEIRKYVSFSKTIRYEEDHPPRFFKLVNDVPQGIAQLQLVTADIHSAHMPFETIMSFNIRRHRAFDVCSEGRIMALVEEEGKGRGKETRTLTLLYRQEGKRDWPRLVEYASPYTPFIPSDVLFFKQHEREYLLVAEEAQSAIHVVDPSLNPHGTPPTRFLGFLAPNHPLIYQPTALALDKKNRVYVACRGRRILRMELELKGLGEWAGGESTCGCEVCGDPSNLHETLSGSVLC